MLTLVAMVISGYQGSLKFQTIEVIFVNVDTKDEADSE